MAYLQRQAGEYSGQRGEVGTRQASTHVDGPWPVLTVFLVESKQHEEKTTEEVQDTDRQVWSGSKAAGAPPKKEGGVRPWPA